MCVLCMHDIYSGARFYNCRFYDIAQLYNLTGGDQIFTACYSILQYSSERNYLIRQSEFTKNGKGFFFVLSFVIFSRQDLLLDLEVVFKGEQMATLLICALKFRCRLQR